jgi:ubiquinone/menaquinone biosynthesis C-methylase UbiE
MQGSCANSVSSETQSLSEKSLCGPSPSEIDAAKAPEAALSLVIRRCKATLDPSIVAGQSPERAFRIDSQKQHVIQVHSQQANEFATSYRELSQNPYRSCFTYSRKRLDTCLQGLLPRQGKGLRVLDVGCGTGYYTARLRQHGFDVTGIDASPEMLEQARVRNPDVALRQADVEHLPFPDASFDIVICIEVLRYLPRSNGCIREMARVLKPGGVCLATAMPLFNLNGYWLVNRLATVLPLLSLVPLKQFFTTAQRLRGEFSRAGFIRPQVQGVYIGPMNWVERLAPGALPGFLRVWERVDAALADHPLVREFSNMFLVRAISRD